MLINFRKESALRWFLGPLLSAVVKEKLDPRQWHTRRICDEFQFSFYGLPSIPWLAVQPGFHADTKATRANLILEIFQASVGNDFDEFKENLGHYGFTRRNTEPSIAAWFAVVVNNMTNHASQVSIFWSCSVLPVLCNF